MVSTHGLQYEESRSVKIKNCKADIYIFCKPHIEWQENVIIGVGLNSSTERTQGGNESSNRQVENTVKIKNC